MKISLLLKKAISAFLCSAMALSLCSTISGGAEAAISLPSIEDIKSLDEGFDILEIVPEDKQGSIGYYIDGKEPWVALAGTKPSKAERAVFVNNKLQTLLNQSYQGPLSDGGNDNAYFELALCEPKQGYQYAVSSENGYPLSFVGGYDEVCPWEKASEPNAYYDYEKQMQLDKEEKSSAVGTMEYVGDGNGDYIAVGRETGRVSDNSYSYVGEGNGSYSFDSSSDGKTYNLSTRTVYYTGGFSNNNWFLKYVFDYDEFEIGQAAINISVNTVTADKASTELINSADMIVLNYGLNINTDYSSTYSSVYENDFPEDIAAANLPGISAAAGAKNNPTAVIFDYNLLNSGNTAVKDAAKLLLNTALNSRNNPDFINKEQHSFVGGSIYIFDILGRIVPAKEGQAEAENKGLPLATADFNQLNLAVGNSLEKDGAFYPVYEEIYYENSIRNLMDKYEEELSPDITMASVIKHIISYSNARQIVPKTSVNVLDLEPGGGSMTEIKRAQVTKALAESAGVAEADISLTVTSMPVSTFNCINRGISEDYDLLFIGDSSVGYNITSESFGGFLGLGATKFKYIISSDEAMTYNSDPNKSGINNATIEKYIENCREGGRKSEISDLVFGVRYSPSALQANDLSESSMAKIKEFAGSGYPIVFANTLVKTHESSDVEDLGDKTVLVSSAEEMFVDSSSLMYETINYILGNANVMSLTELQNSEAAVQQSLLSRYVNISEPEIVFWNNKYPTPYAMDDKGMMNSLADDDGDGIHKLEYVFKIQNDFELSAGTTNYECMLYIDSNGNSIFDEEEKVSDIELYNWTVFSDSYGSSGSKVENSMLEGSYGSDSRNQHYYYLSYRLPSNITGVVPWKLTVRNTSQLGGYDSVEEFTRVVPALPTVINVLQIDSVVEESKTNLQENIENSGIYKELSDKISSDFILNIGTIKSDFINEPVDNNTSYNYFTEGEGNVRVETLLSSSEDKFTKTKTTIAGDASTTEIEEFGTIAELFESYDVLILGFGYDYSELNSELKSAVEEYVKSERPLIVAHNPASRSEESGDDSVRALSLGGIVDSETGGNGKKLTQLNKGQITSYPFDINTKAFKEEGYKPEQFDSISLKSVQEQSYNLNTSGDEVLAWYYLERDENNSEGSNELYAYSLGNVTYMDLGQASGSAEVSEAKLLVNTMVAAYQLENGVSEISFSNENGSVTGIEDFFMVTDGDLILSTNSKYDDFNRRIYFTPNDTYAGENKVMSASFAYNNGQPFTLPIYEAGSGQQVSGTLLSGSTYYIKFGDLLNTLGVNISLNNLKLKITLSTNYEGAAAPVTSEDELTLRQFELFDLS